jgi:hypothetical protein
MKISTILVSLTVPLISGCLHFVNSSDVNLQLDSYFASRNFIAAGKSAFAQDIVGLVGRFAYKDTNGVYQFMNGVYFKNDKKPQVKAVQSAYMYSSKIDKGYKASISTPFISPDVTGKTAKDYEMRDVATAMVEAEGEPLRPEALAKAKEFGAPTNRPLFWIRGVVLADLRQQQSVNLEGKTTITGSGFSANGDIYNNPSASDWIPLVAIDPVPFNELADADVSMEKQSPPTFLNSSPAFNMLVEPPPALREPKYLLDRPKHKGLVPVAINGRPIMEERHQF